MASDPTPPLPSAAPLLSDYIRRPRRLGVLFKMLGIGLLILLLHIPLVMTSGVLEERRGYKDQAAEEIAAVWGRRQLVVGPVLMVPYTYQGLVTRQRVVGDKVVQVREPESIAARAYFLPETLTVDGDIDPDVRRRGIYESIVYLGGLTLTGEFRPDFSALNVTAERIDWARAQVLLSVADLRGVRSLSPWPGGDDAPGAAFEASEIDGLPLAAKVGNAGDATPLSFRLELALQGSDRLEIAPVGKTTRVTLRSSWADPSFVGSFLPVRRDISADGFTATWETAHFSRGFAQQWTDQSTTVENVLGSIRDAGFGVGLYLPVDAYRLVERAQKYGVLFFVLIFAVFFLFETVAQLRIHPLQYALAGAALCLFFLGFLALSEIVAPRWAYLTAAGACTLLVTLYGLTFLRTGRRALVIGGELAATYAYLYFVLQAQDYALVAGAAALFVALALVMYCTRAINWYQTDVPPRAERV
ncbi:MAG TPA: cell envelope integrity protein CreD [Candidatus Synoicihabitans sp.]|nr:cell envelope integrity protein CreD [Candidatus Synoicihabitans sp.]